MRTFFFSCGTRRLRPATLDDPDEGGGREKNLAGVCGETSHLSRINRAHHTAGAYPNKWGAGRSIYDRITTSGASSDQGKRPVPAVFLIGRRP